MEAHTILLSEDEKTVAGCQIKGKEYSVSVTDKEGAHRLEMDEKGFALLFSSMVVLVEKTKLGETIAGHLERSPKAGLMVRTPKEKKKQREDKAQLKFEL